MRIAVIGMGQMGRALATRLAEQGHTVTVWNRSPGRAGEALRHGASEAGSIAEAVAGAGAVITSLADDGAVRQVALGEGGVRDALAEPGRDGVVYADASTISPSLSAELASAFGQFVAMPILGGPGAVREGRATYLAGGAPAAIEVLRPALDVLAAAVRRYQSPPLASTAKLASNLVLLVALNGLAEGIAAGRAGGLSDEQLRELFGDSPVVAAGVRLRLDALLEDGDPGWWTVDLGLKDARLATELAGGPDELPVLAAVQRRFGEASEKGCGDADIAVISRLYRH